MGDTLGDRMKDYENVNRNLLMRRTPVIIRIDGRAFHTYTKQFARPYSSPLRTAMVESAKYVLKDISTGVLAYHQSDEVSFLCLDYKELNTQQFFGGNIQKISSICASVFTAHFNSGINTGKLANFDCRCFNIPREEISNYFLWRWQDNRRNSIAGFAQSKFSHKELQGKNSDDMLSMLIKNGTPWTNEPEPYKNGTLINRYEVELNPNSKDVLVDSIRKQIEEYLNSDPSNDRISYERQNTIPNLSMD